SLARKAGLQRALVSGEDSPLVDRLAAKIAITEVHKNCKDKAAALRTVAEHFHLPLEEICFMGDDVNDLPALALAGLAACPADAQPIVLEKCAFVAKARGGKGAVRELVDHLICHLQSA
ncbi:MAG: HAD hydrolase family protein, partial [Terriglobales bacterium]